MNHLPVQAATAGLLALLVMVVSVCAAGPAGSSGAIDGQTENRHTTAAGGLADVPASASVVSSRSAVEAVLAGGLRGITHPEQTIAPAEHISAPAGSVAVAVNDGCNSGTGVVAVDEKGVLATDGFAVTRMACPGRTAKAATAFHQVVADGAVLLKDGGTYWIARQGLGLQFTPAGGN